MGKPEIKPILVTGSHRSGSTWVGKMMAVSPEVGYIYEPFNRHHRPGICAAHFEYWFPYICNENAALYRKDISRCLQFNYRFSHELRAIRSAKDIARLLRDFSCFSAYRMQKRRPLIKDPLALFSAEWLAQTFDMDVIILIRHPAAFAGSLKKAHWPHPFSHFLHQPLLLKHHLSEFESEIRLFESTPRDIIDQAILLWNIIHAMICIYRRKFPNWTYVRHEDISKDPAFWFSKLYHCVNLQYSKLIEYRIARFSDSRQSITKYYHGDIFRNSKSNVRSWHTRLTEEEIERIRSGTENISGIFYNDEDWEVPSSSEGNHLGNRN